MSGDWLVLHLPLVRLALFSWCVVVWAIGLHCLRPTSAARRAGVMGAWVHGAVGLMLDVGAVRVGAWQYRPMPGTLGGVPLDLHLAWALVWGFLPLWLYSRLTASGVGRRVSAAGYVATWALATLALDAVLGERLPFLARRAASWWLVDLGLLVGVQGLALGVYQAIRSPSVHPVRETWSCRLRSLLYIGTLAGLFYGVLPAIVLSLTGGWSAAPLLGLAEPARLVLALVLPIALGGWAGLLLCDPGRGTPLPPDPPRRLVTTGPYAYVRNPMQIAGLALSLLLVLYHPTPFMLIYAVDMALVAVVLLAPYERGELEAAFGEEYLRYARSVRNWLPRPRPYDPRERASGSGVGTGQPA